MHYFNTEKVTSQTSYDGSKQKAAHLRGRLGSFVAGQFVQLIAGPTAPNTLETFVPTERIDAMAATAINEAISVYSTTVAPWVFFIRRRKRDNIDFSGVDSKGDATL